MRSPALLALELCLGHGWRLCDGKGPASLRGLLLGRQRWPAAQEALTPFLAFFINVFIVFCNKNICWGWALPQVNSLCSRGRLVPPEPGVGARGRG